MIPVDQFLRSLKTILYFTRVPDVIVVDDIHSLDSSDLDSFCKLLHSLATQAKVPMMVTGAPTAPLSSSQSVISWADKDTEYNGMLRLQIDFSTALN